MLRTFLTALAVFCAPTMAAAQSPILFSADNFERANKSFTESSTNQAVLEVLMTKTDVFENIYDLEPGDPFRRLGRSVGMLDLLVRLPDGTQANTTCTATLIAADRIITNNHCVPGTGFTVVQARLRLGFLDRSNAIGELYSVSLPALERNQALDYAILAVSGVPASRYPALPLSFVTPRDRQSAFLIHHPAGQPQRLTRVRCQTGQPVLVDGAVVHHCDTLGGSSGALLLAVDGNRVVSLHRGGVPDPVRPYNLSTPGNTLISVSTELSRLTQRPVTGQESGSTPMPTSDLALLAPQVRNAVLEARRNEVLANAAAARAREAAEQATIAAQRARNGEAGYRVQHYESGGRWEGGWSNDARHGYGIHYPNGDNAGDQYRGQYRDGQRAGVGVYIFSPNASNQNESLRYEGEFSEGQRNGFGVYYWRDGLRHAGPQSNGDKTGSGVHLWPDGRRYDGEWANDDRNGFGVMWNASGGVISQGIWSDDRISTRLTP